MYTWAALVTTSLLRLPIYPITFTATILSSLLQVAAHTSVAKSPVFKRACPFKRAFGSNCTFFAHFFVIQPIFFVILVILKGVLYAQIKQMNDKNPATIKRTTKKYKCPFFSPKVLFCPFFATKMPVFWGKGFV